MRFYSSAAAVASDSKKKDILVIGGGGSGLASAYALENMSQFQVTLVESQNRLGGHIDTIYFYNRKDLRTGVVKRVEGDINQLQLDIAENLVIEESAENTKAALVTVKVGGRDTTVRIFGLAEGGAEFVGPKEAYPNWHKWLGDLSVRLQEFELNADFHRLGTDHHMVLPPIYDKKPKSSGFFGCCEADSISLALTDLSYLAEIQLAIVESQKQVTPDKINSFRTLGQFIEHLKTLPIARILDVTTFASHVLTPLLGAAWGDLQDEAKEYGSHYIMNYLRLGKQWHDASNGLSTYVDEVKRRCEKLDLRLNTRVEKIIPVFDADNSVRYRILQGNGEFLKGRDGRDLLFDEVVNTAPPSAIAGMMPDSFVSDDKEFEKDLVEYKKLLGNVQYYHTVLKFHLDERFATEKGTILHTRIQNVVIDGKDVEVASNTACKEKLGKGPIMKSWVLSGEKGPDDSKVLATREYEHPRLNRAYFLAELKANEMNKKYGDRYGYRTGGILWRGDSHEDAVTIGFINAEMICRKYHCLAQNSRLPLFSDQAGKVITENNQLSTQTKAEVGEAGFCGCVIA